jgi:hypothetical protein
VRVRLPPSAPRVNNTLEDNYRNGTGVERDALGFCP